MFKNFKSVEKTVFGRGSFNQLDAILESKREKPGAAMVFLVDNYFHSKELASRVPAHPEDILIFVDVDPHEPTTEQIDELRDRILNEKGMPIVR